MNTASVSGPRTFLRRMGTAAFLFFLVKGLLWLAAPFLFLWIN
jgi:hypothetical protein